MIAVLVLIFLKVVESFPCENEILNEIHYSSFNDDVIKLVSNVINRTEPASVGIITDSIFLKHLNDRSFTSSLRTQFFFLTIRDAESFEDKPSKNVIKMLMRMKEVRCELYIFLITNGVQMSGFLQFADYQRLLNIKANVLMLYDQRLFTEEHHYLWKRIVHVLFIKKYEQRPGNWFELSTVPFPERINEFFIPKVVNYWTPPNIFKKRKSLWVRKNEKELNGVELKVVIFRHTPTVYGNFKDNQTTNYSGLEIDLIKVLSDKMNFSIKLYETEDAEMEKLGRKYDEKNYTGLLDEVDKSKADIALGDLHHTIFNLNVMDLSIPYNIECLTFITPEILNDNSWKTLIAPFSLGMWIGVLISLIFVGIFFFTFSKLYRFFQNHDTHKNRIYFSKDFFDDLPACLLYTYSMILVVSLPRLPNRWSVRVLTGWWWLYCVLVVVAYRASLTSILANPQPRLTIDSIEELSKSWLKFGAWGDQSREFFLNSTDPFSQKIGKKIVNVDDYEVVIEKVAAGEYALYENSLTLQQLRFGYEKKTEDFKLNLHIMEECAINMPISIGVEKNSPIKSQMDKLIRYAIEGGLIKKWLKDAIMNFESSVEPPLPEAVMNLKKFYGALFVLFCGNLVSLLTFGFELFYWKFFIEKNPYYDRYKRMIIKK